MLRVVAATVAVALLLNVAPAGAQADAGVPADTLADAEAYERDGRMIDALRTAQRALERSIKADAGAAEVEASRVVVNRLLKKIARVTFELAPPDARHPQVTFNGREVPADSLSRKFSIDPGEHLVQANAEGADGGTLVFSRKISVAPGELKTVVVAFEPGVPTPAMGVLACLRDGKSDDDLERCWPNRARASQSGCQSCVVAASDAEGRYWCAIAVCTLAGAFFARKKRRPLR